MIAAALPRVPSATARSSQAEIFLQNAEMPAQRAGAVLDLRAQLRAELVGGAADLRAELGAELVGGAADLRAGGSARSWSEWSVAGCPRGARCGALVSGAADLRAELGAESSSVERQESPREELGAELIGERGAADLVAELGPDFSGSALDIRTQLGAHLVQVGSQLGVHGADF